MPQPPPSLLTHYTAPGCPGTSTHTVAELVVAVEDAGLQVTRLLTENYFDHGSRKNRAYRALGRLMPRSLREGITIVARTP